MKKKDNQRKYLPWVQVAAAFLLLLAAGALLFQAVQEGHQGITMQAGYEGGQDWGKITEEILRRWFLERGMVRSPACWIVTVLLGSLWQLGEIYGVWLLLLLL